MTKKELEALVKLLEARVAALEMRTNYQTYYIPAQQPSWPPYPPVVTWHASQNS